MSRGDDIEACYSKGYLNIDYGKENELELFSRVVAVLKQSKLNLPAPY